MPITERSDIDFNPAKRLAPEAIYASHESFSKSNSATLLDAIPTPVLVTNRFRQIIYANNAFRSNLTSVIHDALLGIRPGEAMECAFLEYAKAGCGTSSFCKECGCAKATLGAICNKAGGESEFHFLREHEGDVSGYDLRVDARNLKLAGEQLYILSITDVSDEKRRRYLERIFFHDIINTAGGARGLAEILHEDISTEHAEDAYQLVQSLNHLVDEIENHKTILAAENNDLAPHCTELDPVFFTKHITAKYSKRRESEGKTVICRPEATTHVSTDYILLGRVLGNMIKNALEASSKGDTITIGSSEDSDGITFWVHNPTVMTDEVQRQVFKRSFSTKGHDRGLGTFSMRLLTQNYLGGKVSFTSTEDEGTTFFAHIPFNSK